MFQIQSKFGKQRYLSFISKNFFIPQRKVCKKHQLNILHRMLIPRIYGISTNIYMYWQNFSSSSLIHTNISYTFLIYTDGIQFYMWGKESINKTFNRFSSVFLIYETTRRRLSFFEQKCSILNFHIIFFASNYF